MSREKETLYTIEETKTALIGDVKKATLYLLPILSQIALSLAVIADNIRGEAERRTDETDYRKE